MARSNKTKHVMQLVTGGAKKTKQTVVVEKRLVHIPTELLNEHLPQTLKRFKVCGCDICKAIITERIISELPNRFVKVDTLSDEEILKSALAEMRPELLKNLAKICIAAKSKPLHNN